MSRSSRFLFLAVLLAAGRAHAAGHTLTAEPREGAKIRVDGDLREWPDRMQSLDQKLSGSSLDARAVVGYDDNAVYLALKVADTKIARTKAGGSGEDHATLSLAFPRGRDYVTYPVDVFPGKPGKVKASVKIRGRSVKGATAVENPTDRLLYLEARIPWSAFPEARKTRVGLRAAVTYTNADSPGNVRSIVSTARGSSGRGLPPLLFEWEQALAALWQEKNLSELPTREAYGDVSGDSRVERVAAFGPFLTISGPGYRNGAELYYGELGVTSGKMLVDLRLTDFDGDGHDEIVLRKRLGSSDKYREVLEVLKLGSDGTPARIFAHEIAIKTPDGEIKNDVSIRDRSIKVSRGHSKGFKQADYSEPLPGDMESAILPWEKDKSHTFRWQGSKMAEVGGAARTPGVVTRTSAQPSSPKPSGPVAPPPPRAPTADELLDRVYALYRKDRGVGRSKPSFDFVTDVAGDTRPERVLVHGKDLVVFGKGFRGGTSYTFITIGVKDKKDVLQVTARDLTGDGKAEIIVRGVMKAKASKALGGDMVSRHALLIYAVRGDSVARIFGAETGRELEGNQILGSVAFQPIGDTVRIELRPARAVGWTEESYPFPADTTAYGGLEPLLLPWSGQKRGYRFRGGEYVADD